MKFLLGAFDLQWLHPRQLADFQASLRAEAGPSQFVAATQEMLNIKGQGFAGTLYGVDVFKSSFVPTANAGADYLGMMIAPGAIGLATGTAAPVMGSETIVPQSPIVVEFERDASNGSTIIVGSAFVGVGEIDDAKGVGILSDF